MKSPFLGGYGVGRSTNVEDSKLFNLFLEVNEDKDGKEIAAFYMTPGLDLLLTLGAGPIRGEQKMKDLLYVVSGKNVYAITSKFVATLFSGTLGTSSGPVSIINNGTQMVIFDGVTGYYVNPSATTVTALQLPFSGTVSASYQDGFGLANVSGSNVIWQTSLGDLTSWPALNFSAADSKPSPIMAIVENHREEWMVKSDCAEVWINAGLSGFAFQRLDGVLPEVGTCAAGSAIRVGQALMWLTQNSEGQCEVIQTRGYETIRVSTAAMEREFLKYPDVSDAIAYSYHQEGHTFYVLTFPSGNATWVFDLTASALAGIPMWHRRAEWLNGNWNRHWSNCGVLFSGKIVVGDYRNGNLYAFNLATQTDNGALRRWLRTWRALRDTSIAPRRFNACQVDMQVGIGIPDGTNPLVCLRWSDDGGHTWSNELKEAVGPTGQTATRVRFRRLGSTARNQGLDRIFELSSSDLFGVALIGAEVE